MADPVVIACAGACTVTHVIDLPLANMTPAEGGQIAGAILAVWVVGWAFRMLVRTLNIDGKQSTENET